MPSRTIVRLNDNDNYLSLGNLFRILKSVSINPQSYLQSDLFCILFDCEKIGSSTVNNYCTGIRSINPKYKNIYIKWKEEYEKDVNVFIPIISKILSLIEYGSYTTANYTLKNINSNEKIKYVCLKLYTISKNDTDINFSFTNKLQNYLNNENYYSFMVEVLFYVILYRVQPLYKESILNEVIEKNLISTNISVSSIEKFMQLQLNSGLWSIRGLSQLAEENNPFACFEMASLEFYGIVSGESRYDKAYEYYKIASDYNHPAATWAIGYLYYYGYIGNKSKDDLNMAYQYFTKSSNLNCSNAYNSLGLIYLNGNVPNIPKDKEKALNFFEKGANLGNVYAYNNLGKLAEKEKNYSQAFNYFKTAADLGESWALNKIGDYFRRGIYVKKDMQKAYEYYQKSSNCSVLTLCYWSKYNLAKYYYEYGLPEENIPKDLPKAIHLLESIASNLIEANEELIYLYYNLFINNNKDKKYLEKINYYINLLEKNPKYNNSIKNKIEKKLTNIKTEKINIDKIILN